MTNAHVQSLISQALTLKANDPELYERGRVWYADACYWCIELALELGIEELAVIGVVAALSPQQSWAKNVKYAEIMCRHHTAGGTLDTLTGVSQNTANIVKAWRILSGELPFTVLGGPKVRAFYDSITSSGRRPVPCIDRHALMAWYLPGETMFKSLTPKRYGIVADDYAEAAAAVGLPVGQFQAVVWVAWRQSAD